MANVTTAYISRKKAYISAQESQDYKLLKENKWLLFSVNEQPLNYNISSRVFHKTDEILEQNSNSPVFL